MNGGEIFTGVQGAGYPVDYKLGGHLNSKMEDTTMQSLIRVAKPPGPSWP